MLDDLRRASAHRRILAPRFRRFADWFAETEPARRAGVTRMAAETGGTHVLPGAVRPFTLTARADRIDVGADGLVIFDYKTGAAPIEAGGRRRPFAAVARSKR